MTFIRAIVCSVALAATAPAWAQKASLGERVTRLEQQAANQNQSSGQANVELLNRLTELQAEVQALRNQLEQIQNENEQLKQRGRDQYVDLDTRLQRLEGGSGAGTPATGAAAAISRPSASTGAAPTTSASSTPAAANANPADEQAAYAAAFEALKRGDYVESAQGFQRYLDSYPQGALAPNAWYWRGESYYVTQNYPVALQSFEQLLAQFPESAKAPDALLKKGYCLLEMRQSEAGQQTLNSVINEYPGSEAARLAESRLRALSLESR